MLRTMNKRTPLYLQAMFSPNDYVCNMRDSAQKLIVPKPRTDNLKRSFSYSGALLWNSLPDCPRVLDGLRNV